MHSHAQETESCRARVITAHAKAKIQKEEDWQAITDGLDADFNSGDDEDDNGGRTGRTSIKAKGEKSTKPSKLDQKIKEIEGVADADSDSKAEQIQEAKYANWRKLSDNLHKQLLFEQSCFTKVVKHTMAQNARCLSVKLVGDMQTEFRSLCNAESTIGNLTSSVSWKTWTPGHQDKFEEAKKVLSKFVSVKKRIESDCKK